MRASTTAGSPLPGRSRSDTLPSSPSITPECTSGPGSRTGRGGSRATPSAPLTTRRGELVGAYARAWRAPLGIAEIVPPEAAQPEHREIDGREASVYHVHRSSFY